MTIRCIVKEVIDRTYKMRDDFLLQSIKCIEEELESHPCGMKITELIEDEMKKLIHDRFAMLRNDRKFKKLVESKDTDVEACNEIAESIHDSFNKEKERLEFLRLIKNFVRETKDEDYNEGEWDITLEYFLIKVLRVKEWERKR